MSEYSHGSLLLTAKAPAAELTLQTIVRILRDSEAVNYTWLLLAVELQANLPDQTTLEFEAQVNEDRMAYRTTLDELATLGSHTTSFTELLLAGSPTIQERERQRCIESRHQFAVVVTALDDWHWEVFSASDTILDRIRTEYLDDPKVDVYAPEVDIEGHPPPTLPAPVSASR